MRIVLVAALLAVAACSWAQYVGDFKAGQTVYCPFMTYDANGDLVTATALVAGDVEIYKNGGAIQRASDNGVTMTANFDAVNGQHMLSIDTSDNTDAGFYTAAPTYYQVLIQPFTVGAQNAVGVSCTFSLGVLTTALTDIGVDHLVGAAVTGPDVADNSIVARLASKNATADWDTFNNTTDSLEANKDGQATLAALNAEVDTALRDINLDHLMFDATAVVTDGSALSQMVGVWSLFNSASGGLTAIRTKLDNGVNPTTDGITASSIAANAIGDSEIAPDAIGSSELAATAVTEITDDVFADIVDGTCTFQMVQRALLAFAAGFANGAPTTTVTFRRQDDTTAAIVMTVDADGNRSAVTIDGC